MTIGASTFDSNAATNNVISANGGAIANAGILTLDTSSGNIVFTGNTVNGLPNDIYNGNLINMTGSGHTISITGGIAGINTSVINKSDGNDLIFGAAANNSNFLGVFTQTAGTTTYHGGVLAGVNNFTNSTLNLWQTGATVGINNLNLTDAIVNSINDSINTFNIASFNATGANDFSIDINGANGTSDQFNITSGTGTGTINVSDFNVVNAPTAVTIDLPVFVGSISGYTFTSSETEVITPIYTYQVTSLGNGVYQLQRASNSSTLNKDVFRGSVSTLASYHNQLSFTNMLFDRVYLETNEDPCAEFISPGKGRLWAKTYGASDKLRMNQGVSTDNRAYGVIVGADFPMVDLGEYWSFSPTLYVAYNGAHQKFEGVSMDQQGGQAGVMGTFRNGDFSTSVLGFAGAYNNRMKVAGNRDSVNNSFTGAAVKTAYDFRLRSDFVIQPTLQATYAVYGSQKWFSTYGNIDMKSGALQAWNVTPGINWIYKQEDWSAFAVTRYSYGNNNSVSGIAGSVVLPELTARSGYVEYGVGAQKKVGEISYFGQLMFQNGARSGAALQVGLAVPF